MARYRSPSKEILKIAKIYGWKWKVDYRSGFEVMQRYALEQAKKKYEYEPVRIAYNKPPTKHHYSPDLRLANGIYLELKGEFTAQMRKKHKWVREQNPELDIRFVFMNAHQKLSKRKGSSTYGEWCTKNGFLWSHKEIPKEWFRK